MVEIGQELEFFKVFLPEFSSHELVIPPAFIDILEKPLPKEALLLDEIGRIWSVETKTDETEDRIRVLFKKGWEIFAKDQSLEFGDFIVFSYDGDSRFSVTIFANDGCKKYLGVDTISNRSRVSVQNEPVKSFTKPERREDCSKRVTPNRIRVSVKEEPDVPISTTEPEYPVDSRRKVNRARDPCGITWVLEKKHKGFKEPVIKPENPHFVRNITEGPIRQMEIPTTFLKSNGIEMEKDIELWDENGKKWPLEIVNDNRKVWFSFDSWVPFFNSHKLRNPNKCLFEFIVESNGRCNQIRVRIFRGELLTITTKNKYQVLAM